VRSSFLALAAEVPERYAVIDAGGDPDAVEAAVREAIAAHLT
jgi:dTMP kinase